MYEPTCPRGYKNCTEDPAYIYTFHYGVYRDMYGDKTPVEVSLNKCLKKVIDDPSEFEKCYSDKDELDFLLSNDWK